MIDHLGLGRLAILLVVGLLVFGPERLPEIAGQAGRAVRQLRQVLHGMTAEIKDSLGPEVGDLDLASLHPRAVVAGLFADEPATGPGAAPTAAGPGASPPPATAVPADDPFAHLALHEHLAPTADLVTRN